MDFQQLPWNSPEQRAWLSALRRDLHAHPETGLHEHRTARRIEEELDALRIPHRRVGETGVLGILRGEPGGGVVALRADIDALPIQEANQVEYRSQNDGVMHACGHDSHTACLLGGARLLAQARFPGEVRLIFQPAEEIGQGAKPFLEAGVMQGADRVFGLHAAPDLPAGTVGLTPGLNNAAVDQFKITVHGQSVHVSTPHLGIDALYIACQTVVALQALVTRRTSPVEPVIIGVGTLRAGTTYNALAKQAVLEGTTRTVSQEMREDVRRWVTQAAEQTAALYGGSAELQWADFASALLNDPRVCKEAAAAAEFLGLRVITDRPVSLGGDNFSEFQLECPGAYAYLGTANPALPHTQHPVHSVDFDLDEDVLPLGAGLYAGYALGWLTGRLAD